MAEAATIPVTSESSIAAERRDRAVLRPSAMALAASNLQKSYGRRRVVDDVSVHVEPGEVVGLLGANGAGKTTTFYMIIGLETPEAGRVMLAEQDVTRLRCTCGRGLDLGIFRKSLLCFAR